MIVQIVGDDEQHVFLALNCRVAKYVKSQQGGSSRRQCVQGAYRPTHNSPLRKNSPHSVANGTTTEI
jgi:hypothetical protein